MTRHLMWTEIKLLTREPVTLVVSLLFPTVLMVLLAGSFGSDPDPTFGGISGIEFYVPVYAAATVAVMGMLGVPTHLAGYRESGVLRRFQAAGVTRATVALSQLAVTAALVVLGSALMVGLGFALYDLTPPEAPVGVAAGFAAGTVAFAGIGVLLGAVVPTARAAQALGLLLFFGLFFVAGGGPPPALLPDTVNTLVDLTPMGPLIEAISAPWHGDGWDITGVIWLSAIGVVGFLIAGRRLRRG